ncbi:MAG: biotin-dependent carboxyltransferase family protein [Burkholderiales bacterium]|jgi:antagonist of KipI|nr:biotin-dependent carboxyltransferase family protein [Burkholderiales bacterium]
MGIQIEHPGLLSTLQDLGRTGLQHLGVPVNGAMDETSHRMANLLVGNAEEEATLEITLSGPRLHFQEDAVIAVCGANMAPMIDGEPLPMWRPVRVRAGVRLLFGRPQIGCRAYLAVAAGFDVPAVMGSRATAVRGAYGGFNGRALRKGDVLPLRSPEEAHTARWVGLLAHKQSRFAYPNWSVSRHKMPYRVVPQPLRILPGRHWQNFPVVMREQLVEAEYRVGNDSDRMGYRLSGPALDARRSHDVLSEGMVTGAVQVPPGGQPIILMADHQTTGGYPVIAVVIGVDLPVVAQLAPGDTLRFKLATQEESYAAAIAREQQLELVRQALAVRLR